MTEPNELNDIMDFDRVIEVLPDGSVIIRSDEYGPDLHDGELESGSGWTLMDGYSGQWGYSGPMMHQSEFIGGQMARDILAEPGLCVALVNYELDTEDGEPVDPTEWAVARKDQP